MENLARYIIQASFSHERMTYLPEPVESLKVERESRIIYRSKDNRQEKDFDALDWSRLWRDNVSRGFVKKIRKPTSLTYLNMLFDPLHKDTGQTVEFK